MLKTVSTNAQACTSNRYNNNSCEKKCELEFTPSSTSSDSKRASMAKIQTDSKITCGGTKHRWCSSCVGAPKGHCCRDRDGCDGIPEEYCISLRRSNPNPANIKVKNVYRNLQNFSNFQKKKSQHNILSNDSSQDEQPNSMRKKLYSKSNEITGQKNSKKKVNRGVERIEPTIIESIHMKLDTWRSSEEYLGYNHNLNYDKHYDGNRGGDHNHHQNYLSDNKGVFKNLNSENSDNVAMSRSTKEIPSPEIKEIKHSSLNNKDIGSNNDLKKSGRVGNSDDSDTPDSSKEKFFAFDRADQDEYSKFLNSKSQHNSSFHKLIDKYCQDNDIAFLMNSENKSIVSMSATRSPSKNPQTINNNYNIYQGSPSQRKSQIRWQLTFWSNNENSRVQSSARLSNSIDLEIEKTIKDLEKGWERTIQNKKYDQYLWLAGKNIKTWDFNKLEGVEDTAELKHIIRELELQNREKETELINMSIHVKDLTRLSRALIRKVKRLQDER